MADDSDEEQVGEEQVKEEPVPEKPKKIFINHVDTYHGKNIARIFARVKPGSTGDTGGEEEEAAEEENGDQRQKQLYDENPIENGWKVSGTIKNTQGYKRAPFMQEIIQYKDRNQLTEYLKEMNVIIYDITQDPEQVDEAVWACQKLESLINELDHQITFILLSSVMTWAKTPANEDEVPYSEDEFRRRRAHPNFKERHSAEKLITKLGLTNKKKLLTYVVATGLTYGMEENVFHYIFKAAWHNVPEVPVFGKGQNSLPTIHIIDLAAVLQNLADQQFKIRYIVATDTSKDTLIRITRKVSQALGMGRVKTVDEEDAMLNRDITQADYDMLLSNMQFEPMFIREQMNIKWHCENGIPENIEKIVEEYRTQRNLRPIKICVLGPPAAGKTTIAKQLAQEYKLHYLSIKDVIEETKNELEQLVKRSDESEQNEEEIDEEDTDETLADRVDEARSVLERLEEARRDNKDARLDDDLLTQIFKIKLMSPPCQNQGYVLDGYPKTSDQAQNLFGAAGEEEEEGAEDKKPPVNEQIIPEHVVILEASNDFLRQRIMHLPEKVVAGTHNTELEFKRRLKTYNDLGDDSHPAKFFEEVDRPGETMKIDDDVSVNHRNIVKKIMERVKEPRNYGPTAEEQEIAKRNEIAEKEKREREDREERERNEEEAANDRAKKQKDWTTKLEQIKREEFQMLDAQSTPLRNYLMAHVMPTLTKALIECCQVRPDDPIDFVAEYLFKENPQV
ncbi:unnamed protein product [Adineta steineri]|uniref:Adenylate kinase 7 n=1 Tax=Adineta steineri TaxID=433720 RepID=A0A816BHA7_9BILA|nr:unnamed protein product [Adineta steineri]CAF1609208.1 unnamed protein product [Adineta steineri]